MKLFQHLKALGEMKMWTVDWAASERCGRAYRLVILQPLPPNLHGSKDQRQDFAKRAMEGIWKLLSTDWGCHQYLVSFVCLWFAHA